MLRLVSLFAIVATLPVTSANAEVVRSPVAAAANADIDAIRAAGKRWAEYYATGRFSEIPDLYTTDTMVMPRGRPRIEGREAMRRAIGGLAAGRKVQIDVIEREIRAVGDYGWYVGDFRVTYISPTPGVAPVTENGRSLIIYRRDGDGRWRVHRDIDSPAPQLATAVASGAAPPLARGAERVPAMWDPAARKQAVECDRLTASRYDRTRLAPPKARAEIDVARAIVVCEADLARLRGDPRLTFQLGRLYGYSGDAAKTRTYREASAAAGNHNAIFLLGYLDYAAAKTDAARCAAASRIKLAADRGNYSAQLTYASYLLEGKLGPCTDRASVDEVATYVAGAKANVDGFFETRLADHLAHQLKATPSTSARARLEHQMQGVWTGTFRRYDAQGALVETLPSEVRVRFVRGVPGRDYEQTNILRYPDGRVERIDTSGAWEGDVLRFANARVDGRFGAVEADPSGLTSVLTMRISGPGDPTMVSEVVTLSPDGTRRSRATQYLTDGKITRRTLIDEVRTALLAAESPG